MKPTYEELAVQLANAESKCRELAAENGHARERHVFIRALAVSILEHSGGRMDWRGAMEDATDLLKTVDSVYAKKPATDAFLAEVRASELDSLAGVAETMLVKFSNQQCSSDMHEVVGWKMVLQQATNRAAQLRKGVAL
ncbi:hypothetical protein QU896_03940 [Citrobacter freundii]|uniref:hypothetical protein n=1 Tax=Citrobacter freundii TaxID=546 RepID=UPI0019004491|nr:hypothetical protein [Citrobacter freundii]MBJ8882291.1 hypothetical protein [Citrobacter freundii]MDE9641575.1 hypothetical protein [Citrobacter freundii]MDT7355622.1 hypothetical protein [Citrobacter freundii]MEB0828278.1 hypothetical protein [Citrobacter freundii]MEB2698533.1 hypothetical protein [Citrobacter freundii]